IRRFSTQIRGENDEYFGRFYIFEDITNRKQFEAALLESEQRFSLFMDYLPALVFIKDNNSKMIYANNAMEIGLGASEWMNKSLIDVFGSETAERIIEDDNNTIQLGYQLIEESFTNLDGTLHHYETQKFAIPRVGKNPLLGGISLDITERKMAEVLVTQTKQNYETFFNTIDDFLFVLDEQGNIIHVNDTVINRLEYSKEELSEQSVLMVHPAERREEAGRIVGEMLAGSADFCPVPLITKSGIPIPVETKVKTGFWNGKPVIFGVSKDISRIQLSEEKFSKAFHSNSASMAINSYGDGLFIDVNDAFVSTMGYSRNELIGKTSFELNLFENVDDRENIYTILKDNSKISDLEFEVTRRNGEKITGLFSAEQIYVGNNLCILSLFVDITERKKAEEEMRKAQLEAEKANMAKSEFLSRMSHELRTPMNSILGFAQLLEMGDLNTGQKRGVNHIMNSGKHLLDLINQVLDISRIEAGRLLISIEPVRLNAVFEEMMDIINPLAIKNVIDVKLVYSSINQLYVSADRQSFKQILLNLLNNAIKYNKEGGSVEIKTELITNKNTSFIRISITDTGVGIKQEDISKIFIPFERISAYNTQIEGTGLGLSVVKKLVEVMNGSCGVDSEIGNGSTFWFELPQAKNPKEMFDKSVLTKELISELNEKRGTLLYIEDNLSNIELVEQILATKRPHIKLITNMTGKETVNLAIKNKPDLILLDLNLPDIDGSEVLKLILENDKTKTIPVIILSADGMQHQVEKLIMLGAKKYMTKPLEVKEFIRVIDEIICN
ncbi:MAG: PAS domain S-box protein, partial [Paludibacter sp.]